MASITTVPAIATYQFIVSERSKDRNWDAEFVEHIDAEDKDTNVYSITFQSIGSIFDLAGDRHCVEAQTDAALKIEIQKSAQVNLLISQGISVLASLEKPTSFGPCNYQPDI